MFADGAEANAEIANPFSTLLRMTEAMLPNTNKLRKSPGVHLSYSAKLQDLCSSRLLLLYLIELPPKIKCLFDILTPLSRLWSQEERIRVLFQSQLFSLDEAGAEAAS